jgi:hypothetical protein
MVLNVKNKIYKIEALSVFKMTYYIKAKNESDALDEYAWNGKSDDFKEGSQTHLEEIFSDVVELSEEEFLQDFDKRNDYLKEWSKEQKMNMINEIDYN